MNTTLPQLDEYWVENEERLYECDNKSKEAVTQNTMRGAKSLSERGTNLLK